MKQEDDLSLKSGDSDKSQKYHSRQLSSEVQLVPDKVAEIKNNLNSIFEVEN